MALTNEVVHILAQSLTPRLQYACKVVFECLLGLDYSVVYVADAQQESGPVLVYGDADWANGLEITNTYFLKAHGLLAQTGTQPIDHPEKLEQDPLAAIFWLATHYAAYGHGHPTDHHGRPQPAFLPSHQDPQLPVCHALAYQLAEKLGIDVSGPLLPQTHYPTLDIDNAFAYLAKGPFRWAGGLAKEVLAGGKKAALRRIRHALGLIDDPYDNHSRILEAWKGQPFAIFFLMRSGTEHDHAISIKHPDFKRLVTVYSQAGAAIGLHPSYAFGQDLAALKSEKQDLEHLLEGPITQSRHHYLRLLTPHTQRILLELGIRDDYSAGPVQPGFWQGMSVSFPWYDVAADQETALTMHPACWMDAHFAQHPEEGLKVLGQLLEKLAPFGGRLISIWHNDYFAKYAACQGFGRIIFG